MRRKLFNIEIDNLSRTELLDQFASGVLVTPNVDHLILLKNNSAFLDAYRAANYVVVDSQIVFWAMKWLARPVKEKISGSDFLPAYCAHHASKNQTSLLKKKIFILGGMPGVAQAAMKAINERHNTMIVIGAHSPSMNFANDPDEINKVIELIEKSGANSLVVGLGAPKQELWIHQYKSRFVSINSFLAVGAAIDFEAGNVARAPSWMSSCGLEWFYRLYKEPKRMWRRYLVNDPAFFLMLLAEKFKT
jgi:N-acetylglucosaminyldiphosphoundecaprenol N-acetyl-beta-D-mannosaminyltransferase